jgi:hypothetical protein
MARFLPSLSRNLAVHKRKAILGFRNLFLQVGSQLRQQIPMLFRRRLGIEKQLRNLTRHQAAMLRIQRRNIALRMMNLPRDAKQLSSRILTRNRSMNLAMIIQQALQRLAIASSVRLVSPGHQQREVLLFRRIACKVRMDASRNLAKQRL